MKPLIIQAEWSFFIVIFIAENISEASKALFMSHSRKCKSQRASQIIYNITEKLQNTGKKREENINKP